MLFSFPDKLLLEFFQRQAERNRQNKANTRRGDDAEPGIRPELIPVARFHGSRLSSAPTPSPYQRPSGHAHKVARHSTSGASVGAAIVEAEKHLDLEVHGLDFGRHASLKHLCELFLSFLFHY